MLKGQSNEIIDLQFYSSFEPTCATDQRLKYFRFWLRIRWVIQILSPKIWLPGVSYPGESVSPGYHTLASQSPRGIIPLRVNLPGVSYPGESIKNLPNHDSMGYDTPVSQSPRGIIPWRVSFFDTKVRITRRNRKYLNPLISVPGWFEWWKITGSRKSHWTVPLKVHSNFICNIQFFS